MLLEKRDFFLAFALHGLVMIVIFSLNQWRENHKPIPERVIQVNMVSLQELQAMVQKAKPTAKLEQKVEVEKETPSQPKPKQKPKPIATIQPKKKTEKKAVEEDPNYDPFAPLESSKVNKRKTNKISGEQALHELLKKQLSHQELESYIVGMQKAVERQWKVPTEMIGRVKDALVELKLFRNGKVAGVKILESSGSETLDRTLVQAIYAAQPFDVPTQQFELFKTNTIRFFPLQ